MAKRQRLESTMSEGTSSGTQEDSQLKGSYLQIVKVDKPRQIAFATTGEMVVCEFESNCVTVFDPSSNYRRLHSFGSHGTEETIRKPSGIAISSDNTVFITASDSVKKFTLDGNFIASVGSCGSGRLQFDNTSSIAYNATNNRVYVCDTRNNRITVLNYNLTFHESFGSASHEFNMPNGIAVDKKGNVVGDCKIMEEFKYLMQVDTIYHLSLIASFFNPVVCLLDLMGQFTL